MEEQYVIPELQTTITSYELMGDKWTASVSHTFHASDQETLFRLIESHKMIDPYFSASFIGKFECFGGTIWLMNSDINVAFP